MHRHFHINPRSSHTPNVSLPPSRTGSPAPLIGGGGGVPDPGNSPSHHSVSTGNDKRRKRSGPGSASSDDGPGVATSCLRVASAAHSFQEVVVSGGGGSAGSRVLRAGGKGLFTITLPNGDTRLIRMSVSFMALGTVARRKWKSVLFLSVCLFITILGLNGAMYSEWRETTYYRVDPYPILPHGLSEHSSSQAAAWPMQPVEPSSDPGTCPGPNGKLIPRAPLQLYPTPDTHPAPMVGDARQVGIDTEHCLTYRGRYSMYSDEALGITYRKAVINGDLQKLKEDAVANVKLKKVQPDDAIPSITATGLHVFGADHAGGAAAAAATAKSAMNSPIGAGSTTADGSVEDPDSIDPLMGRQKPKWMKEEDWERILREDMWKANEGTELLGPSSFPDWRALMDACFERRELERGRGGGVDTFRPDDVNPLLAGVDNADVAHKFKTTPQTKRTALVMRAYEGYPWREDDILNLRALISELSLNNPNTPYDVRILVEVKGQHLSVFTSEWDRLNVLRSSVPREFWGLVEFWTETELGALYPGLPGKFLNQMMAHTSYRACLMALQKFWLDHQEYDFIWNWEMDVRYIGNYLDFFEGIEGYARKEPLHTGMDKYNSFFVRNVTVSEENWRDDPSLKTGRGDEADMITLSPIFDPEGSGWFWEYDVQNYPKGQRTPRRASIGTNMRMSRSLLEAMNVVNAEAKKSLHCEAWPTTLVLHSQLPISHDQSFYPEAGFTHSLPMPFKGVFAPHPIYFRHFWDAEVLHSRINRPDFYRKSNEKVMRDSSFYYDGAHSKEIYVGWKEGEYVCRSPQLLHPIKRVN